MNAKILTVGLLLTALIATPGAMALPQASPCSSPEANQVDCIASIAGCDWPSSAAERAYCGAFQLASNEYDAAEPYVNLVMSVVLQIVDDFVTGPGGELIDCLTGTGPCDPLG